MSPDLFGSDLFGNPVQAPAHGPKLSDTFLYPPFSVWNAREGWWQERKAAWLRLGIQSEVGRVDKDFARTLPSELSPLSTAFRLDGVSSPSGGQMGASIFDPVVCELVYRWFAPPSGLVLDPFAGGSVRGIVAARLGLRYYGIELRPEQIASNEEQAAAICKEIAATPVDAFHKGLTPIEQRGSYYFKRDDFFVVAGVRGGKARTCWRLARGAAGLVTAGSRTSPQAAIVASIARRLDVPCRIHTTQGILGAELALARRCGAEVLQHKAGYNSVITARARSDAEARGWTEIPFGMECPEAVEETANQLAEIPDGVKRIVIPVGSGMTLAGVVVGMLRTGRRIPILGVRVGADPVNRLDAYAPGWRDCVNLQEAASRYADAAPDIEAEGVELDAHYEAKCTDFLRPDDLLWIVGRRPSAEPPRAPCCWRLGDARNMAAYPGERADLVFTCPPYGDLERYSDDNRDLSTMDWPQFRGGYGAAIERAAERLAPDRFAVFVVGNYRAKDGGYRDLVGETVKRAEAAGLRYYNEAVLVTAVGSLPIRIRKQFDAGRKLGKTHQNVLVFVKGDWRKAAKACQS